MDLLTPSAGLIIWMLIGFSIAFYVLAKFAWKPIVSALKERDNSISEALQAAEKARLEVAQLNTQSEKILAEAKSERDKILKETQELKESILSEASEKAKQEGHKLIEEARKVIASERIAAIHEIKKQVSELSVSISEKVLMRELSDPAGQKEFIEQSLRDIQLS